HQPPEESPFRYIAAFPVTHRESLLGITRYLDICRQQGRIPDALLLDAHAPGLYGGTGRTAPWELLADFQPGIPIILAGGLTPDNVAEAIRMVQPFGVDVASGVESRPGVKDPDKVRRFIDNARAVGVQGPKSKSQGFWPADGPGTRDQGPGTKLP
ncbi:MAG TPA: phosphoribosylanthranilate isomerase, partial [Gemmataceae bacterium]|nr:phosphoribosylanthranilate isomerase [Gemmataceae bacterium]